MLYWFLFVQQQCESAIITHISPLSGPSFTSHPPTVGHQSTRLGSLHYIATSHQLSICFTGDSEFSFYYLTTPSLFPLAVRLCSPLKFRPKPSSSPSFQSVVPICPFGALISASLYQGWSKL